MTKDKHAAKRSRIGRLCWPRQPGVGKQGIHSAEQQQLELQRWIAIFCRIALTMCEIIYKSIILLNVLESRSLECIQSRNLLGRASVRRRSGPNCIYSSLAVRAVMSGLYWMT